jgi:transposase
VSRPSPFAVALTASQRRVLQARVRRPTAQQREVLRARIVLAAADGEQNTRIAGQLGVAVNTVSKWRKRFVEEAFPGWGTASGRAGRAASPSAVVIQVKAIACELPAVRAVPLGRWSLAELREEVLAAGLVDDVSVSTIWRWLAEDALKPWRHRSWIFPRARDFAAKAAVVLDLYARRFGGRRLEPGEFVVSADEKTSIQARCRCHPTLPPAAARLMRIEHEYQRRGRWPTWRPGTCTRHDCSDAASPPPASSPLAGWWSRS